MRSDSKKIDEKIQGLIDTCKEVIEIDSAWLIGAPTQSKIKRVFSDVDIVLIPNKGLIGPSTIMDLRNCFEYFERECKGVIVRASEEESFRVTEERSGNILFHILLTPKDILFTLNYLSPLCEQWIKNCNLIYGHTKPDILHPEENPAIEKILWSSHSGAAKNLFNLYDKAIDFGIEKIPIKEILHYTIYSADLFYTQMTGKISYSIQEVINNFNEKFPSLNKGKILETFYSIYASTRYPEDERDFLFRLSVNFLFGLIKAIKEEGFSWI